MERKVSNELEIFLVLIGLLIVLTIVFSFYAFGFVTSSDNNLSNNNLLVVDKKKSGEEQISRIGNFRSQCDFSLDIDLDDDKIDDGCDNCPNFYNPLQEDSDFDGLGDLCDLGGKKGKRGPKEEGVICRSDRDCGISGFFGNPFCENNNIMQFFLKYICVGAGKKDSFCSNEKELKLKSTCSFACFNGECIRCDEDKDCDDNNKDTLDICVNPKTKESFCVNEKIGKAECNDGVDNDGDGAIDYPEDFSCSSFEDTDETNPKAQCQDGLDNDNDYMVDMEDPSCLSLQDNNEFPVDLTQCADRIDNDKDGYIDLLDPDCRDKTDNDEAR